MGFFLKAEYYVGLYLVKLNSLSNEENSTYSNGNGCRTFDGQRSGSAACHR